MRSRAKSGKELPSAFTSTFEFDRKRGWSKKGEGDAKKSARTFLSKFELLAPPEALDRALEGPEMARERARLDVVEGVLALEEVRCGGPADEQTARFARALGVSVQRARKVLRGGVELPVSSLADLARTVRGRVHLRVSASGRARLTVDRD